MQTDTESSKEMMKSILSNWSENEIYRIDHFLGEELARNLLYLRFANETLIDGFLNKDKVGTVLIELDEEFGCEGRGGYFDEFGMIRDVLQNRELRMLGGDKTTTEGLNLVYHLLFKYRHLATRGSTRHG